MTHLVFWTSVVNYFICRWPSFEKRCVCGHWFTATLAMTTVSLVFDARDVVEYFMEGERAAVMPTETSVFWFLRP